ncbi:MAG TPA: hypothetical protein VI819_02090 [Patescibacteria group bacterium]|nr:hypothetical protein [Patescibacteria group bacterium]
MVRELNYDGLVTPPEFEDRCNMFLDEIEKVITPKYPDLEISQRNETTEGYAIDEEVKKTMIQLIGPEKFRKYFNRNTLLQRLNDQLSISENTAVVDICGNSELSIPRIVTSAHEVIELAEKYRGIYQPYGGNEELVKVLMEIPESPFAYLHFIFRD